MKKIGIIFIIVIVILVGTLLIVPIFFKQNLLELTKTTINKQVNADVEFADFNLSLFKKFPKATIELEDVIIVGVGDFEKDTLLNVSLVKATISITSLFKQSGINIEEIILDQPQLKLLVNNEGNANWDVAKAPNTDSSTTHDNSENSFELQLENIEIQDASFLYSDLPAKMTMVMSDINFIISGKMYGTLAELVTEGEVGDFLFNYAGANYISNTSLETKTLLNVDYEKMNFTIKENELLVNNLGLELNGSIEIPSDSILFDLQIETQESDFKNFLALVPTEYSEYLKDINTNGSATITGSANGIYYEDNYPAFSLNMDVENGNFQYADFPEQIKNISADVKISKPQGELNLMEILINKSHAEIKNNPVDLSLTVNNLISDPWFDGAFIGKINFDHLKDVIPLDSVNISGEIDANLFVKGNYSSIEKEEYEKVKSDGIVLLDNFVYDSPELTQLINISKGELDFSPKNINLKEFRMKVGQSDFNLSGIISNYLNYVLKDGTLKGNVKLNSGLVNLNELLRLQVIEEENIEVADKQKTEDQSEEVLAFNIPDNIDFTFQSKVDKAIFDNMLISDINGLITAKEKKLVLNGLNMKMLDGELKINGSYENTPQNNPLIDFGLDIISFDIPKAYSTMSGIQKMLPVAGHSQGKLNTQIKMNGQLSAAHKLIASSINGNGVLSTENLQILNSPIFNQLKGILKSEKLQNVSIDDFKANFNIEEGNMELKPFKTKVADQDATIYGSLSAQNLLNMRLDFNIQRDAFGPDIQNILNVLPGNEKISVVPAGVKIEGPVGKPEVKMDLSETRKTITDATKDDLQNSLNKLGKGLRKLFDN